MNLLEFTEAEKLEFNLNIPTEAEIDFLLEQLTQEVPTCGNSSQNSVVPNAFCVCSRNMTGANTTFCDICE
jgi:hypothetical protein